MKRDTKIQITTAAVTIAAIILITLIFYRPNHAYSTYYNYSREHTFVFKLEYDYYNCRRLEAQNVIYRLSHPIMLELQNAPFIEFPINYQYQMREQLDSLNKHTKIKIKNFKVESIKFQLDY
jgi:hypothetical protein